VKIYASHLSVQRGRFAQEETPVVEERPLSVMANGQEPATLLATPFIVSRTSPTFLAVESAERPGISLIGCVRNQTFNVYSHPQQIHYRRPGVRRKAVRAARFATGAGSLEARRGGSGALSDDA